MVATLEQRSASKIEGGVKAMPLTEHGRRQNLGRDSGEGHAVGSVRQRE
jgi:hypothetical protein